MGIHINWPRNKTDPAPFENSSPASASGDSSDDDDGRFGDVFGLGSNDALGEADDDFEDTAASVTASSGLRNCCLQRDDIGSN
jgi:hypothetical protein